MFTPGDEAEPVGDEPKTEAPGADPPTETGPTFLKCGVCGETMESEEGALSARCPLCGGVMRQYDDDELVVTEKLEPRPEVEPEPEPEPEPERERKPKRRKKRRRRRKSRLSTRHAGRIGGLKERMGLGEPIPIEYRIGFGRRLLALFLDGLIVGAVGAVMGVLLVTFYCDELNEIFSYPADVKKAAEIDSGALVPPMDDALEDDEALEEEEEAEGMEDAVPLAPSDEGAEEREVPPEFVRPRLLFDGRLGKAIAVILSVFFVLPFFGIVELSTSASIGKKILALSVRGEDGRPAAGNSLFGRFMIKYGPGVSMVLAVLATTAVARALGDIILVIGALDGLFFIVSSFVALSSSKQAVHDQLLFTAVYPDVIPGQPDEM
jgi:hypothetical protein